MSFIGHPASTKKDLALLCIFDGLRARSTVNDGDHILVFIAFDTGRNEVQFHRSQLQIIGDMLQVIGRLKITIKAANAHTSNKV